MRNGLYIAAAAALLIAAPAAAGKRAQSTELSSQGIHLEGPGVGVRVGRGVRDYNRDRRRHRHWRDREVRGDRGDGCRRVTVRETRPDRTVVTRTRTNC